MTPQDFTQHVGGRWAQSYGTAPCPVCQPKQRRDQTALTIAGSAGRLLLHCKKAGCDFRDILAAAGVKGQSPETDPRAVREFERLRHEHERGRIERARRIWDQSQPITGTNGETYLGARGITCAMPSALRWLPDTYHTPSGAFCSAMVADVSTGGIHRTFFTKKGARLTKNAKMMFGPCGGGAVRLCDSRGPLVVCEGLETGLSLLSGLLSGPAAVWAALSTSGIAGLLLPSQPGELVIATDGDDAGREAGDKLGNRATVEGWSVSLMPAPDGADWNDVLRARGAA